MSSYKEYPTWPVYLYLTDDDLSKSLQQPAARHPSNNMVPRCCFSALPLHEVKGNDHSEKMDGHIVVGKHKERQNKENKLDQKWVYKHLCKLSHIDPDASVYLDTLEMSIFPLSQ